MTTAQTTIHDGEAGTMTLAPWHGPEGGYALWHKGDVVWKSAGPTICLACGTVSDNEACDCTRLNTGTRRATYCPARIIPAPPTSEQTDD